MPINTAYMANCIRLNFGYAETSYILEPLYGIARILDVVNRI